MPKYVVNHDYESSEDGVRWGPWEAGTELNLAPEEADMLNADSPGVVALKVVEPEPVTEPDPPQDPEKVEPVREKTPAKNRMNTGGSNRTG